MKLLTFSPRGGTPRIGLAADADFVLDIGAAAAAAGKALPFDAADMVSLIAAGPAALAAIAALSGRREGHSLSAVRVLAPIPRPRKNVFCVGWNYLEHFEEGERIRKSGEELPKHPVFFSKAPTTVIGPHDPIPWDQRVTDKLDWEVELAVIIGPGGKNISEAQAMGHVFGYTVLNDVSARDLQRRHGGQWMKGKSLDGTCPMGPVIVTADEVNPDDLRVACRVNGETKQDSNTRHFYFKIPRIIAELSLGMTLEAGDVISTGTPQGVGFARTPPEYLKAGHVVETEIGGIGLMRNPVQPVEGR